MKNAAVKKHSRIFMEKEYGKLLFGGLVGGEAWLPLWGSCRACEAEGVSLVGWDTALEIGIRFHSTDGTPPGLASSATPLREGGKGPANNNLSGRYYDVCIRRAVTQRQSSLA